MPIESNQNHSTPSNGSVGEVYLDQARQTLNESMQKILHCLNQLPEKDLQWRPFESHNSIQNVILHLCGNLRQWIGHGVGNIPDDRDRPAEFANRDSIPKQQLIEKLQEAVAEADAVMAQFPPDRLTQPRRVQGFDCTLLGVIFESVSHFVGHTHQIVYITRLRLGEEYRFQWVPTSVNEGRSG